MDRAIPVQDVIFLGNNVDPNDPPLGSPVRDVPPFEIKDVPPIEPLPWIAPQPNGPDDFIDSTADA